MNASEVWQSIERIERVTPRIEKREERRRKPGERPFPNVTEGEVGEAVEPEDETPTLPRKPRDSEHTIDIVVASRTAADPGLPTRQMLPGRLTNPTLH